MKRKENKRNAENVRMGKGQERLAWGSETLTFLAPRLALQRYRKIYGYVASTYGGIRTRLNSCRRGLGCTLGREGDGENKEGRGV